MPVAGWAVAVSVVNEAGGTLPTVIDIGGDVTMPKFQIRENGKNGSVEVLDDRIIRIRKKFVGKKDIQTIPVKAH